MDKTTAAIEAEARKLNPEEQIRSLFLRSIQLKQDILAGDHIKILATMGETIAHSLANGGKLLLCGNGGSAADAQHLAAELLVRLQPHINRQGIPAIALTMDMASLTACANDYGYDHFFERGVVTLGRSGDVLLGITTSGNSPNVIKALQAARQKGITSLGFLGGLGGPALSECDQAFVVPSKETGRIQEAHITAGHALMELVENALLERGAITIKG